MIESLEVRAELSREVMEDICGELHAGPMMRTHDTVYVTVKTTPGEGQKIVEAAFDDKLRLVVNE